MQNTRACPPTSGASLASIFSFGFRPFFALAALAAMLLPVLWLAWLLGLRWPGAPLDGLHWHSHEMLYGFMGAAVAGFVLTAVPGFTKRPPVTGGPLMVLAGLWLLARLVAACGASLPAVATLAPDVVFLCAIALLAGRDVILAGNRRNLVLVALVLLLAATALADQQRWLRAGAAPGLQVMVVLLTLIGGRIVPSFTGNWLRSRGVVDEPARRRPLEVAVVLLTLATALSDTFGEGAWVAAVAALAALAQGLRLAGWRGWSTRGEPLLFVLHVGYAWLVLGLLLLALSGLGVVPRVAALHALGLGAMGTMILAVMSRAALGHTGRPLQASRPMVLAYLLVSVAALARVGASLWVGAWMPLVVGALLAWMLAFGIYLWRFSPILMKPREV